MPRRLPRGKLALIATISITIIITIITTMITILVTIARSLMLTGSRELRHAAPGRGGRMSCNA